MKCYLHIVSCIPSLLDCPPSSPVKPRSSCSITILTHTSRHEWIRGEQPRQWSRQTLGSLPLKSTPKSHLSAEQPLMEKNWNLLEKIVYS